MNLIQPYYIEKRTGDCHISLDGEWDFCYGDAEKESVGALRFEYKTNIPASVYHSLHCAGVLPDPYYGENSRLYRWVDEKIWYYRKRFSLSRPDFKGNAFLCFEGVSYFSRLWINGVLIGEHEGMFGGPVCDARDFLNFNGENEIIVEVKACNFGRKADYSKWWENRDVGEIVPWNVTRDTETSNGDFIVMGLWGSVRLELTPSLHLSRPYLYTEAINDGFALLSFECEISDGQIKELSPYFGTPDIITQYCRAFDTGVTGSVKEQTVQIGIRISHGDEVAYAENEDVPLCDFDRLGMSNDYYELQFYRKKIELKNPHLWYPNGMGEPFLYDVAVTLSCDGKIYDEHLFKFGVRTFDSDYTAGNKYRARWEKFLFSVNGERTFLKGINWMPIDFLYDLSPERYEWCLTMAKNMGVQIIRVWNGGGFPETDTFYELCDRLGLMVWQDLFIANANTPRFSQSLLESQTAYNLYRLRNHPSLVLLCGGNEFNPYSEGNAASMFVIDRTVRTLTPDRIFHYTTADKGSAHVYIDMEPVWYRHRYAHLPFLAESGIHSFPNYKSIKRLISEKEANGALPDLSSEEFAKNYPELLNHFSEYIPERVPRMTARISQVVDMKRLTLEELCEASHVQAYEFYQLMIQSMRENFPRCGGVMPWVFKRSWTTAAVQTVDGNDLPTLSYYSIQNAYRPLGICWRQEWSVLAPREALSLCVRVFNQHGESLSGATVSLTVYRPDFTVFAEYSQEYSEIVDFGRVSLDDGFTDTCFLVCAELSRGTEILSRSVYFNKCTSLLSDAELYKKYRSEPKENLRLDNGPHLKPCISSANRATIEAIAVGEGKNGRYAFTDIRIKNVSDFPAFPITVEPTDDDMRYFLDDNFFLLKAGEEKTVRLTSKEGAPSHLRVKLWNGNAVII